MSESRIRLGFVGVGSMGQMAHLRNYVNIDDCEVVALCDLRQETAKLVAQRYGVPRYYTNPDDMFKSEKLDGVIATMWFQFHGSTLPDLYRKTKYIFTEKPLALAAKTGEDLVQAAAKAGCTHMVGYHKRSDPAIMFAKDVMKKWKQTGEMGKFKYVRITSPSGEWTGNGRIGLLSADDEPIGKMGEAEPPLADIAPELADTYRAFVNVNIHQINLLRYLLDENYTINYADPSGVLIAAESASGIPAVIETNPYRTSIDWQENMLIAFEYGYIKVNLPAPLSINLAGTVEIFKDPGNETTPEQICPTLPRVHAMRQQAINFIRVCKGEIAPPCDAAEAAEDLKTAREYFTVRYGK